MNLINMTAENLSWHFDSRLYTVEAGKVMEVADDIGNHLLSHLERRGLTRVTLSDLNDPKRMARLQYDALYRAMAFHKAQVMSHEQVNALQKERGFPSLPMSPAVRAAERMVPVYQERVEKLQQALEIDEDRKVMDEARKVLSAIEVPTAPDLEALSLEQLRREATERGIDFPVNANTRTLISLLRKTEQ